MRESARTLARTLCCGACIAFELTLAMCKTHGTLREMTPDVVAQPPMDREDTPVRPMTRQCFEGLVAARRGGAAPDRYVPPTDADRRAMMDLFADLARGGSNSEPFASAAALIGYRITDVSEIRGALLLAEIETQRRGGGAYILRPGSRSRVVVQAPHTFFDEGTLPLACELFERSSAAALFVDTAHRYKAAGVDERGNYPADVAHAKNSLFQGATEGILRAYPRSTVVQLHGFGPRESGANVVLSAGVAQRAAPIVEAARTALLAIGVGSVLRFPEDTTQLGATTNVQGAVVRAAGATFLHIEIGASLRRSMLSDDELRGRFLDAIARSVNDQ